MLSKENKYYSKKEISGYIDGKNKLYKYIMIYSFKRHNRKYLKKEKEECLDLFKNVNGYELDKQQIDAILKEEDSTLLVAGAGSGKTLTMIGKIKYLTERKNIDPKKILCLSFTNAITSDFEKGIEQSFGFKMDVLTFHKLGMNVLSLNNIPINMCDEHLLRMITEKHLYLCDKKDLIKYFGKDIEKRYRIETTIETFLRFFKANNYEDWDFILEKIKKIKNRLVKKKNEYMYFLMKNIYEEYQNILLKNEQIDFDDMIIEAAKLIEDGYSYPKYDYIIVDEYQDTSYARYRLLKAIKDKNNCHLLAVGDDWQSIYRFTGCNLEMFTDFKNYFPYSSILKIETTYRNSNELIDVASNFIMKNPYQIKKELKSFKKLKNPIKIYFYNEENEISNLFSYIGGKKIYILGRNNKDSEFLNKLTDFKVINDKVIYLNNKDLDIKYLTVHKSKGLECDNAIIINLRNNILGFPSQIEDETILKLLKKKDLYDYEEERRLFYVALTRTKNNVYLFVPYKDKSIFVEEILRYKKNIEIISNRKV